MYALPFDGFGESGKINVQELFPNPLSSFHGGTSAGLADQIMFWYNGGYKNLYLFSTTATTAAALSRHGKWINPGTVPDASWGTGNQPSTVQIEPTQGFWYMRQKGATTSFELQIEQPYSL